MFKYCTKYPSSPSIRTHQFFVISSVLLYDVSFNITRKLVMQFGKLVLLGLSVLCAQSNVWAGAMSASYAGFSGLWAGAGGSYDYTTLSGRTNITQISSAPSTVEYLMNDNLN